MGIDDKIRNAAEDLAGKAKEGVGKLTDNERLEAEGKAQQVEADARKKVEGATDKAADAAQGVADKLR